VATKTVELSAGTIEYEDTGADGAVLVLLPGLLMDSSLWESVIAELAPARRCIAPTLPLGAHRHPAASDADLSLPGLARLTEEFLERLQLDDVTLVGNDTGGAIVQLIAIGGAPRVGRIVLVSCDAFDNYPPGVSGKSLVLTGRLPAPLFRLAMQPLRLRPFRRMPLSFGWLTKRGDALVKHWIAPVLEQREIRRDTIRLLRSIAADKDLMDKVAGRLPQFDRPALVVWAAKDRIMPPEHGRRLAGLLPQGRFVEVEDSRTLVPLDQPRRLAHLIHDFSA